MALAYPTSTDVILGSTSSVLKIDLHKPSKPTQFNHRGDVSFVDYLSKLLALGNTSGSVDIFDPASNAIVKSFQSHNGLISDLDVKGNYMATCGYSARPKRYGNTSTSDFVVDPLVNIYDLRMMRAVAPIPFPAGASFAHFYPKLPNIVVIASTTGQIQFVDMYDQLQVYLYQADLTSANAPANSVAAPTLTHLHNLDVSENGEFLAFRDDNSTLHLWGIGAGNSGNFTSFPSSLDMPDVSMQPSSSNAVGLNNDNVPLNSVGMPYYKEFLASNFPSEMIFTKELLKLPKAIDEQLLDFARLNPGKILPYDKTKFGPRNVVKEHRPLNAHTHNKKGQAILAAFAPEFLSERSNTASRLPTNGAYGSADVSFTDNNPNDNENLNNSLRPDTAEEDNKTIFQYKTSIKNVVPSCYSRIDIQYSKFGVDDFDFDYYNQSDGRLCGLENHLDNSYANSLLQIYRFIPIFYNVVTESLLDEWLPNSAESILDQHNPQGSSILNELAYLFDMMYKAGSRSVSISNFSMLVNESAIAKAHGLVVKDEGRSLTARDLQMLIITFNKFLVESVISDYAKQFKFYIQDLTAMHYELNIVSHSGEVFEPQYGTQATLDLVTPPANVLNKLSGIMGQNATYTPPQAIATKRNHNLLTYLEYSLNQVRVLPAGGSHAYPVDVKQTLTKLGPILLINLPFSNQEFNLIKSYKKWLVPEFYVTLSANKKINFKPVITQFNQQADKYELQGYVCEISHDSTESRGKHNLVSYVKVKSPASGKDQWFLFNDFLVMPIVEEEVFNISYSWKKPVVLVYHNVESPHNREFSYFDIQVFRSLSRLDDNILYRDHFACGIREGYKKEYELLTRQEAPEPGSLVAIDAEFVSLNSEQVEIRYNGKTNLLRPKVLSLARISALRGNDGDSFGVPFIDDYIVHTSSIHDYLTTFSGIEEGDLDPQRSKKTLVTLQTAYRRLWLLLNLGCVFVGHGLKSDFRCINLQVPKAQIRDTIEFFYLPDHRRKLSLKFLAYAVLKEAVQTENHDSIEDAKAALLLYKKYLQLKSAGEFDQVLLRVYLEGQNLRFRVPG